MTDMPELDQFSPEPDDPCLCCGRTLSCYCHEHPHRLIECPGACDKARPGWFCTRGAHADGTPCAAVPMCSGDGIHLGLGISWGTICPNCNGHPAAAGRACKCAPRGCPRSCPCEVHHGK